MARPQRKTEKVRLSLELSHQVKRRLENIVVQSDADSMSEVIRHALAIYEVLIECRRNEEKVVIRSTDGSERELVIY